MDRVISPEFLWGSAYLFARISAFLAAAPLLPGLGTPRMLRPLWALGITAMLAPLGLASPAPGAQLADHLAVLLRETGLGLLLGTAVHIPFAAIEGAGHVLDLQMGLGIASILDPTTRRQRSLVASLLGTMGFLVFLTLDGHLWLLRGLAESFRTIPPAGPWPRAEGLRVLIEMTPLVLTAAVRLAAPLIAVLLLTEISLGLIAKTMPQMNLLVLGLPVRIGIGFLMLAGALPLLGPLIEALLREFMRDWTSLLSSF